MPLQSISIRGRLGNVGSIRFELEFLLDPQAMTATIGVQVGDFYAPSGRSLLVEVVIWILRRIAKLLLILGFGTNESDND